MVIYILQNDIGWFISYLEFLSRMLRHSCFYMNFGVLKFCNMNYWICAGKVPLEVVKENLVRLHTWKVYIF